MARLIDILRDGRLVSEHRPWRRAIVSRQAWEAAVGGLASGDLKLAGLWGDGSVVHLALIQDGVPAVISLECQDRRFPSVARSCAPAVRLERAIRDLWGLEADGTPDGRPWLDHGVWGVTAPLGEARPTTPDAGTVYAFLPIDGEGLHQIPVGPVHAGIIEPGHFRFTANGETVVRLEERLGYVHKGIESLMAGADLERAAQLAGRTSGDSTVAYAFAFARAAEAALSVEAPPRAIWLRAVMAEVERLANHFGDIGAICNDASFALLHAHLGLLREEALRVADACFGHRLMRDRIVPGGVAVDLDAAGVARLREFVANARRRFPALVELYENTASLKERTVSTGILTQDLAERFGAGGFVGRASGRNVDARVRPGYPPYDRLRFAVPVVAAGDVNARVWVRVREVGESLGLIDQLLDGLPSGDLRLPAATLAGRSGEGMAFVEAFRGDVMAWLALGPDGRVRRCHLRDASWFQWPLLEAVVEGNIVADFPLCNKSFNCSYSGHDL